MTASHCEVLEEPQRRLHKVEPSDWTEANSDQISFSFFFTSFSFFSPLLFSPCFSSLLSLEENEKDSFLLMQAMKIPSQSSLKTAESRCRCAETDYSATNHLTLMSVSSAPSFHPASQFVRHQPNHAPRNSSFPPSLSFPA